MNFYTCSIFRLDRFNFIPYRLDENIRVYRETGEVLAFYADDTRIRRDGQIDGVNGIEDSQAYDAVFCQTADRIRIGDSYGKIFTGCL